MNDYKKVKRDKGGLRAQQAVDQNVEHPIYEPKFIRGPTEYQTGRFRSIREGPKNKSSAESNGEELSAIKMKPQEGEVPKVGLVDEVESAEASLSFGSLPNKKKAILSRRKNDPADKVNTAEAKAVNMARAKTLYKNGQSTYAENVDKAFVHFLEPDTTANQFVKYLEEAAHQAETESILKIFPFLKSDEDLVQLKGLLSQKEKGQDFDQDSIDHQIAKVRAKLYDDQLKKVQFKKRVEKLLREVPETTPDDEAFWLWVWLRKLLRALEEEFDDLKDNIDFNKPM